MTMASIAYRLFVGLASGGIAGAATDIFLFPLDTIKTRLQSKIGFKNTGGFRNIYQGFFACIMGSIPATALFFFSQEACDMLFKYTGVREKVLKDNDLLLDIICTSISEALACTIRVPAETIKQRLQVDRTKRMGATINDIKKREGIRGFYRAYFPMLSREIPFSCIEYPLYRFLNRKLHAYYGISPTSELPGWALASVGAISGAVAAALTTPFDTIKTRVVLFKLHDVSKCRNPTAFTAIKCLYQESNRNIFILFVKLFSGVVPRVLWMSIGGYIYFGTYEGARSLFTSMAPHLMKSDNVTAGTGDKVKED